MKPINCPKPSQRGAVNPRILLILFIALLATLGIWFWYGKKGVQPGETEKVRVAYAPVVLNLPSYIAQDRGLFAKAGLNVEYTSFSSANDMINALVAGQVDVVTGVSLVPILNLEAQSPGKARVFLHSLMTAETPYDGVIVKKDSTIQGLADLVGKKVGVFPGTTATNLMKAALKKNGIDPTKVELVTLPPPSHLSALEAGAVDALLAYEPTLSTALDQGARRIFGSIFADLLSPSPISSSVVSRKFASEHPDAFKKFAAVLDQAITQIRQDTASCRPSLVTHTKITPQVAEKVNLVPDVLSSELKPDAVQAFVDLLVSLGELPKKVDAHALLSEK
jgi:ABC-type nitrate/sulfonate/bicarbonate transport system substrate-binding protein